MRTFGTPLKRITTKGHSQIPCKQKRLPSKTQPRRSGRRRVLSGIQPSGDLHLGNYLGAIKLWVERQDEKENYFCIVDLHAITLPHDPDALRSPHARQSLPCTSRPVSNPTECPIFVQSHLTAHSEACWLAELRDAARLARTHDAVQGQGRSLRQQRAHLDGAARVPRPDGLRHPPVQRRRGAGRAKDQKQHVELSRDIAQRFNHMFGETFVLPEPMIPEIGARVMGFDDPIRKMSKSYEHIRGHLVKMVDEPKGDRAHDQARRHRFGERHRLLG